MQPSSNLGLLETPWNFPLCTGLTNMVVFVTSFDLCKENIWCYISDLFRRISGAICFVIIRLEMVSNKNSFKFFSLLQLY